MSTLDLFLIKFLGLYDSPPNISPRGNFKEQEQEVKQLILNIYTECDAYT